jgi:hypothetical protein
MHLLFNKLSPFKHEVHMVALRLQVKQVESQEIQFIPSETYPFGQVCKQVVL